MSNAQLIISWLKYIDENFLSEERYQVLSSLDINDPVEQEQIILITMQEEIRGLNKISRISMLRILDEVQDYQEAEVRRGKCNEV
ncbi:hypothetical protein [Massilia sp. erpn]|uniref:hypothetical protein n=1 Tax=Massilia sp. erpn TaxID=2738142 RepID=UPI002102AA31|nr:hypothetical protein [Massilia sp. erpn]UTY57191.1 hypothetical protein HPQ68_08290 [Massilia sp. erpn]